MASDDGPADDAAPVADVADDPAWQFTAWLLPAGAGVTALLTAGQTISGALDPATGYSGAFILALLCAAFLRDARRRARADRWVRVEVHEFALPLVLLLATLVLFARGGAFVTCLPALLTLPPVAWEFIHAPALAQVKRLFPYALPVLNDGEPAEALADSEVEGIVRDVLDNLPADISARMEGWTVEVREEMLPRPSDRVIYGVCFPGAHVIAIYQRPHLLYHGRGEPLRHAVTYTVLHEIAHALGLDEIGVRRLGWLADPALGDDITRHDPG